VGGLFAELNVAADLELFMASLGMGKFVTVLFITLMTCFLGMVIPGSSLVVIFGPAIISTFAAVGIDPILAAAMLPCICGVMCGITPPLTLGMYAGMSIAESDFGKTVKNDLWWVLGQYLLEVIVLLGWLPILGL
jgi:TRAP-type C4-dicarboxylate transport system permease large subunit